MFSQSPKISIIIPAHNEEGNITPLLGNIASSCQGISHEIILIDDGSTDQTFNEALNFKQARPNVTLIKLMRNFGQTAALAAGIDAAKGEFIVTLDGDGQNDPQDIPLLLQKLGEGFDVVSGWRKSRKDQLFLKIIPSKFANGLISMVTGLHLHDFGCTLKIYRASLIKNIQLAGEMHRFLPAWCAWRGGRISEIPVRHHPRVKGKSKYGILRIFNVLVDLTTLKFFSGFLPKPNYLFSGLALVFWGISIFSCALAVFDKFGPDKFPSYRIPLLLAAVFFGIIAFLLVLMGLLAELLVRLYYSINHQKPYVIKSENNT